jgi:hypothetical protein
MTEQAWKYGIGNGVADVRQLRERVWPTLY